MLQSIPPEHFLDTDDARVYHPIDGCPRAPGMNSPTPESHSWATMLLEVAEM